MRSKDLIRESLQQNLSGLHVYRQHQTDMIDKIVGGKFETTHEVAAKERHRKKPSKKDGEKRREEKLRGSKRVVSENKAATAQKGKALRHGKGHRGR